jgi:DNA invertase Pin-like site-specific DNA recombinase
VQADLCSDRVKRALAVAKSRGKKLGTRNRKVAGKGAAARKKKLESQAIKLLPKIAKLYRLGYGGRIVQRNLNKDAAALRMNDRKIYHLSKVQRIVKVLQKKRLLR